MDWNDRNIMNEKIRFVNWRGNWIFLGDSDMIPTRQHDVLEEIKEKERELGAMLRFQRDLEGRYP